MAYFYNNAWYNTEDSANAAVIDLKSRLENNPRDWCMIKEITGSDSDGWLIPSDDLALSDSDSLNLDPNKMYNVSSGPDADNWIGINGTEAAEKVSELRTRYANWIRANEMTKTYPPTNVDMSSFVSE